MSHPVAIGRARAPSAMRRISVLALAASLWTGVTATAQTQGEAAAPSSSAPSAPSAPPPPGRMLDLGSATCAQFMGLSRLEKDQIVLWLAGYYAGAAQRPRIDVSLLSGASGALDELCAKAPATTLIGQETRPLLLR